MRLNSRLLIGLITTIALLGLAGSAPFAHAQDGPWQPPTMIFASEGSLAEGSMSMVADQAGGVHLFFPHRPDEDAVIGIDYLHWDGETWSGPYSVIVNADDSNVGHVRAVIDAQQVIHVIWGGGMNQLYYASAPAAEAASALSWSPPVSLGAAITEAGMAVAPDDTLVVAFSNADTMGTVSVTISYDGGETWSTPTPAVLTQGGIAPDAVSVAVDDAGGLHLTWTGATLPSGEPLVGVFYARSLDSGLTWSEPLQIDDDRHGEIRAGTVGENEIHLVWRSNIGGDGTFHQWSPDGGDTWSAVNQLEDSGGMSGLPSFVVDSIGALHYVIGPGYATTFRDGSLGPYIDVVGGALRDEASQDPRKSPGERAVMTITSGNQLHVVFETNFNKLWHTQKQLDAPEITPLPLPEPQSMLAAAIPTQEARPQATAAPEQATPAVVVERPAIDSSRSQSSGSTAQIILISVGPVVLLVGLVVLLQTRRTLRR